MKVVVVGIDGAGKTTFIERVAVYLRARGVCVACVRVPDFDVLPRGLQTLGKSVSLGWRFADSRGSTTLVVFFLIIATLLFFAAQWSARKAQVILIEHHPRIDLPAFAHLWGGRMVGLLCRVIARMWRAPDVAVILDVSVEIALERIEKRGLPLQIQETDETLRRLSELLHISAVRAVPGCFFLKDPDPEVFAAAIHKRLTKEEIYPCSQKYQRTVLMLKNK